MNSLYLALVHSPVRNKNGDEVTTSVTNLDIHDISRSCRTYGIEKYFIVTPIKAQTELVDAILEHWRKDSGGEYNPDRQQAMSIVKVLPSIEDVVENIKLLDKVDPLVVITAAGLSEYDGVEKQLLERVMLDNRPILLLFGTGWGLTEGVIDKADFRLKPIFGDAEDGYNHLSVRSAVAIYCDRIITEKNNLLGE